MLVGIERTDERERSSIFSATAGLLAAYNANAVRTAATNPNFDPARFITGTDTIYITAPEHRQALCAPLIVGLLEQIRAGRVNPTRPRTALAVSRQAGELAGVARATVVASFAPHPTAGIEVWRAPPWAEG